MKQHQTPVFDKFTISLFIIVAEEIIEDTMFTVHGPSVRPFITLSNTHSGTPSFINIYNIALTSFLGTLTLSDHVVVHCCIYTCLSRPLYAPVDTAL